MSKDGDNDKTEYFDPSKYEEEDAGAKFSRKAKESPFVPVGIAIGLAGLAYGAYNFKNKGQMSTSVYLIHLRVGVQGAIISALAIGVGYTMYQNYFSKSVSDFIHKKKEP